jgi:hypothetical protein
VLEKFAAVLFAISIYVGPAHARILGSSSLTHAHFPTY